METMKGGRWKARVKSEHAEFEKVLLDSVGGDSTAGKEMIESAILEFEAAAQEAEMSADWIMGAETHAPVRVIHKSGGVIEWNWIGDSLKEAVRHPLVGDIAMDSEGPGSPTVFYTVETGHGADIYKLVAAGRDGKQKWTYTAGAKGDGIGQYIVASKGRVYMLEGAAPHRYNRLVSIDARTGGDKRLHFTEEDASMMLNLVLAENGCLFLEADNGIDMRLFHVVRGRVEELGGGTGRRFVPVGYGSGAQEPCYFMREGSGGGPWVPYGAALKRLHFYKGTLSHEIEYVVLSCGLVVYVSHGQRYIDIYSKKSGKRVAGTSLLGEIELNRWAIWEGSVGRAVEYLVYAPGISPTKGRILVEEREFEPLRPVTIYGDKIHIDYAVSEDGTRVKWVLCWNGSRRPQALIATVYGAYGLPTNLATTRWKPYIQRGFAIGFALVRGGGDHTQAWADAGKRAGKLRGVEDFEACVRGMQKYLGLPSKATAVFGRSAGGYIIGSAVARNPDGRLFKVAYTEVPYVDVLRTASNPALPLTEYEYMEFGNPARVIGDFGGILDIAPIESLRPSGAPGVFVLCRTSENDTSVYAYESLKWVDALRGHKRASGTEKKIVYVGADQGHMVHGMEQHFERAEDFLILCEKMLGKK
jgi:hypothetical protein